MIYSVASSENPTMLQTIAIIKVELDRETTMGDDTKFYEQYKIEINDNPRPRSDITHRKQENVVMLSQHLGSGYTPLETTDLEAIEKSGEIIDADDVIREFKERVLDYIQGKEVSDISVIQRPHTTIL